MNLLSVYAGGNIVFEYAEFINVIWCVHSVLQGVKFEFNVSLRFCVLESVYMKMFMCLEISQKML